MTNLGHPTNPLEYILGAGPVACVDSCVDSDCMELNSAPLLTVSS